MKRQGPAMRFATGVAAASLVVGSAASAAPAGLQSVDPLVAVSLLGTASSQAAVCASSTAAAAAAAAAAQGAQPGCVLPVVDAPPPVPVTQAPLEPVYVPPAATGGGIGVLPLLLGLAAIAGGLALLLGDDEDGDDNIEIPTSPA